MTAAIRFGESLTKADLLWGGLLSCGRLLIGLRRLATAAQDGILPHGPKTSRLPVCLEKLSAIGLVAALFISSGVAAPSFSHRVHLNQKLTCTACHSSAPASTKASDNNLPKPEICATCHGVQGKARPLEAPIKKPRTLMVTKFNHQLHLKLGNVAAVIARAIDSESYLSPPGEIRKHLNTKNSCAACHRALEHSNEVSMAAFPQMADCLVCHNQIDPPFTCAKCHDEGAKLKPADHTTDYLDRHTKRGTIQNKESCAVCHGRRFTCLGCH
jgi:hypothetical protein